jgi:hypothetical protein
MISQEGKLTSTRTRASRRTAAAVVGVLTLLAAAVGARGVGSHAQAASVADLAGLRDQAVAVLDRLQIKGLTGYSVGIDPSLQRIGVYLFTAPGAPAPDLVGLRAKLGADADLHARTGTLQLTASTGGGSRLRPPRGGTCATGFAIALHDGRQGFLTAAHCFDVSRPANQQQASTVNFLPMTGLEYHFDPSDWGIFTFDSATDEAVGVIDRSNGAYPVRAVVPPAMDLAICKTGPTTQTTCGKITLPNTEAVVPPVKDANGNIIRLGVRLTGLFQNNVCSEDGDSGAPVYTDPAGVANAPVDAVGIMSVSEYVKDATGKSVCVEKIDGPGTSVGYSVPLTTITATATNPFTVKTGT